VAGSIQREDQLPSSGYGPNHPNPLVLNAFISTKNMKVLWPQGKIDVSHVLYDVMGATGCLLRRLSIAASPSAPGHCLHVHVFCPRASEIHSSASHRVTALEAMRLTSHQWSFGCFIVMGMKLWWFNPIHCGQRQEQAAGQES